MGKVMIAKSHFLMGSPPFFREWLPVSGIVLLPMVTKAIQNPLRDRENNINDSNKKT